MHRPCILLVEPDRDCRDALGALLEAEGYDVYSAQTGTQCLARTLIYHPDVVVLEYRLPGSITFEAIVRDLKVLRIPPAMIAYTGFHLREPDARAAGIDAFVLKPAVDQLVSLIRQLTSRSTASRVALRPPSRF